MTAIWLSPGLPAPASSVVAGLGPDVELAPGPVPPPGVSVAVATVFERGLLEHLASTSEAGRLVLLKPPGSATPDLPDLPGPVTVVEAAEVGAVVAALREAVEAPSVPWSASPAGPGAASALAPAGWLQQPAPTGELPSVAAGSGTRTSRHNWLASAGIVGVAALAAVVVLATQGGASGTQPQGFSRGLPPGAGGYGGLGGAQVPGTQGSGGANDPGSDGSGRAAERQAFLDCLAKNGVDIDSSSTDGPPRLDPSDPAVATALQQCSSLRPQRGMRPGGRGMDPNGGTGFGGPPPGQLPGQSGSSQSGSGQTDQAPAQTT